MESNLVCNHTYLRHEYDYGQNCTTWSPATNQSWPLQFPKKKIHLGQTSPVGTMSKATNLEISQFFFSEQVVVVMVIVINSVIGGFSRVTQYDWLLQLSYYRCLITAQCLITLSDYNDTEWLVKYKAADAPITFKEIVMVMINLGSTISEEKLISDKSFFWKMLEFLKREL